MDAISGYNIEVDFAGYNDEFHTLAISELGAFLPNSLLAIGSDRRLIWAPLVK